MHKKDYHNWSKDKLIHEIKSLLKRKKFGLVFPEKEEDVAKKCDNFLPILTEINNKRIDNNKDDLKHILIEGDNYHALSTLCYTHKKKIDVIYIDPPYNTGSKSWVYNNDYVEKDDRFKHSKWLSFMEKRLKLAKNLLKDDGAIIIAIDDNEQAYLGVLLDEIFKNHERHCITIVHNPRGVQGKNFSYTHEYAFFVFPEGKKIIADKKISDEEISWSNFRNWGSESLRNDAKNCFYPIIIENDEIIDFGEVLSDKISPKQQTEEKNGKFYVYPIDSKGVERKWRYARQSVETVKHLLKAKKIKNGKGYEIMIGKDFGKHKTVWIDTRYDANEYGTKILKDIIPNCDFNFPKSLYSVYDCLYSIVSERKNAIILDFFAGSGTTGHAVLELNKEDNGKRQFILCTNNELNGIGSKLAEDNPKEDKEKFGICQRITYPRIKKAINGYKNFKNKKILGLGGNLRYYKTDFTNAVRKDSDKRLLVKKSTEMLCLTENTFDKILEKKDSFAIFENSQKITGIIYDEDAIDDFREAIKDFQKFIVVYVFSYDHNYNEEDFEGISNIIEIKPIPEVILNIYQKIYKKIRKSKNS